MRFVALAGVCLLIVAGLLLWRVASIDAALKEFQLRPVPITRWPSQPRTWYRPDGWPILSRLRRAMFGLYVVASIGVLLLAYACPKL